MNKKVIKLLFYCIIICCIVLSACTPVKNNLEWALSMAGANRGELEKVIAYYSRNKADSLKLKAAMFLIENMPGHYSYDDSLIYVYYAKADSILAQPIDIDQKISAMVAATEAYPNLSQHIKQDITFVSADYLIYHIEKAFEAWPQGPWASFLTFDQFCEYILPYKCRELQELDYWRDSLSVKYDSILTVYVSQSDENRNNTLEAAHTVHTEFKERLAIHLLDQRQITSTIYPLLSAHNIDRLAFGLCDDYCVLTLATLRSQGIPGAMDFVPLWGRKWLGHDWNVTFSKWGMEIPYDGIIGNWPADRFWPINESKPKVYRRTYAINHEIFNYLNTAKYPLPVLCNIFCKDVTSHYGLTTDIEIFIQNRKAVKDIYVYLSVFNNIDWSVVAFSPVKRRKALFQNVGRDIVYLPLGYNGDSLVAIEDPLLVRVDGRVEKLKADTVNKQTVRLTRKYFKDNHVAGMESRIFLGRIQGANSPDFSDAKTFYQIDSLWIPYYLSLNNDQKYRYWRYIAHETKPSNIAEIMFYQKGDTLPSYGRMITRDPGSFANDPNVAPEKAFDGDPLTCYDPPFINDKFVGGSWIGFDYGEPICIDRATVIPRSDDNAVRPGD